MTLGIISIFRNFPNSVFSLRMTLPTDSCYHVKIFFTLVTIAVLHPRKERGDRSNSFEELKRPGGG